MIIHTDWYQSGSREKNFSAAEKNIATSKNPFSLSIATIPAESIPFIGVVVLIADSGYELYAACETVRALGKSTRRYQKIFWSLFGERTNTKIGGRQ